MSKLITNSSKTNTSGLNYEMPNDKDFEASVERFLSDDFITGDLAWA